MFITKKIICDNSHILSKENDIDIEQVSKILTEEHFDLREQQIILEENTNIFNLKYEVLKKSIETLKKYFSNQILFKEQLVSEPILIGVTSEEVLRKYLEESEG